MTCKPTMSFFLVSGHHNFTVKFFVTLRTGVIRAMYSFAMSVIGPFCFEIFSLTTRHFALKLFHFVYDALFNFERISQQLARNSAERIMGTLNRRPILWRRDFFALFKGGVSNISYRYLTLTGQLILFEKARNNIKGVFNQMYFVLLFTYYNLLAEKNCQQRRVYIVDLWIAQFLSKSAWIYEFYAVSSCAVSTSL